MGFFDWFKNSNQRVPSEDQAVSAALPALEWRGSDDFEVASCHGGDALKYLNQQRLEGKSNGFNVILLGGEVDYNSLAENKSFSKSPVSELLQRVPKIDVEDWLSKRVEEDSEAYQANLGEWPATPPDAGGVSAHLEVLSRKPKSVVYLAKLPTGRNWEAPVYIGMGGWNACPDAVVLSAFAKRWEELYGAQIVSITRDVMEFIVTRPPTTRDAALALAKEQYLFCNDIVDQGVGDISALAATLLNAKYWYFWWD
jgi:hypothetical protein